MLVGFDLLYTRFWRPENSDKAELLAPKGGENSEILAFVEGCVRLGDLRCEGVGLLRLSELLVINKANEVFVCG